MGRQAVLRRLRPAVMAAALVAIAGSASGLSGTAAASTRASAAATTSPSVIAKAKATVLANAGWPKKWEGPTTPTKPQKVKNIVVISCSQATSCATEVAGVVSGAKAIGWKTTVVDGKGSPSVESAAIRTAVVSGASGIVLASIDVSTITDALKFAKAHHVPVINNGAITAQKAGINPNLVAGSNPDPNALRGVVSADWMIWNSNGKAGVVIFRTTDAGLQTRDAATVATLKKCSGCKILFQSVVGFNITTTPMMTQEVNSILSKYGSAVKYIRDPYSAADAFAVPALQTAGRNDVQVLSDAPTSLQMQQCYQGKNIGAVYGDNLNWVGWEAVDMMNRVLQHPGVTPPAEHTVYAMFLSPASAYVRPGTPKSKECPASGNFNAGNPVNYQAKYKALWGIK